jgi:beta-glucosidase/6-phospho-beta-glucosidase/beta-galactosidase/ABC-type amino acid transport substrate-binding protein
MSRALPDRDSAARFPLSFLFGVATADHQCEAHDPAVEDVRDLWERKVGQTPRGRATDFWHRYSEDVRLASGLGCRAFRFSVAWARVEPRPGQYDEQAFQHYRELIAAIRAAGMQPILTLLHFTWPLHVEEAGGLIDPEFPVRFRVYATEVARRLGEGVRYWITLNEPTLLPWGYLKLWSQRHYAMPPGLGNASCARQVEAVAHLIHNLFLSHAAAREAIRAEHPEARVGANPFVLGLPGWFQSWLDRRLTHTRLREDWIAREVRAAARQPWVNGDADVILAMLTMTSERERQVLFSESYFAARMVFLVRAGHPARSLADLKGAAVAVVRSTTAEYELPRLLPQARPVAVKHHAEGFAAVRDGRAVAMLTDDTMMPSYVAVAGEPACTIATPLPGEAYAAAVGLGNQALLDAVDTAIVDFKRSGQWARSFAKHFPSRLSASPPEIAVRATLGRQTEGPPAVASAPADLKRLALRGRVIFAVKGDVPGFSARDPHTGELHGFEIDLGRAIAKRILGDERCAEFRIAETRKRIPTLRPFRRMLSEYMLRVRSLSTMLNTNWWHLGMAGRLPEFLCPSECVGKQDFVGFDYYWGIPSFRIHRLLRLFDSMRQRYDRAPVWPGGLHRLLRSYDRMFGGQEILIVENGCVDATDGHDRARYLRRHLREVARARQEGVNVSGYICWSITSNREWGLPFAPHSDFGLYHVDLDRDPVLERVPTPAAEAFADAIRAERA